MSTIKHTAQTRTKKRRREIISVLAELSAPELELELLRRAQSRTLSACILQKTVLADLEKKYAAQTTEIKRQVALMEGGV